MIEQLTLSYTAYENVKWKTFWKFLIKLSIHITYDPNIPLLNTRDK